MISEEIDDYADGTINNRNTYTYDANGNLISKVYQADNNGDGRINYRYTYNASNQVILEEVDEIESRTSYFKTKTYDANGNLIFEDVNGLFTTAYTYNADDHLIS